MRRSLLRIVLTVGILTWPVSALANPPANVTGLAAKFQNSQILVHWDAPEGDNVTTYRIYFGQKSILDNGGAYDDFRSTSGKNTDFTMTDVPPYQQIFLSVLAVNSNGEESPSFVEEVQLDLSGAGADGQKAGQPNAVPSPSHKQQEAQTLGLIGVAASSSTTLQLTFSQPVHIPVDRAIEAFTAVDAQGLPLQLRRIVIEGSSVELTTGAQVPGRRYAVRVNDVVTGEPTPGTELPLDPLRSIVVVEGYTGNGAVATPTLLPPTAQVLTAPGISTRSPAKPSGSLFTSGLPILGIVMASGAAAGWRSMLWKKKEQPAVL